MTAAALPGMTWSQGFAGAARPYAAEAARTAWRYELGETLGGAGEFIYEVAASVQKAAGAAAIGSSALPIIGAVPLAGSIASYFTMAAIKGAVRTAAENKAMDRVGLPESAHGGAGRFALNAVKSLNPFG